VQLVIGDTGPINYLVLIGHIDILSALFEKILITFAVRDWIARPPAWLEVRKSPAHSSGDDVLSLLGRLLLIATSNFERAIDEALLSGRSR